MMRTALIATTFTALLVALTVIAAETKAFPADDYERCTDDFAKAISRARASLEADSPLEDRRALVCLVLAVEALNREINDANASLRDVQQELDDAAIGTQGHNPVRLRVIDGPRPEVRP